jgi:formylglycine-generating enzyme required for sulfatase activity
LGRESGYFAYRSLNLTTASLPLFWYTTGGQLLHHSSHHQGWIRDDLPDIPVPSIFICRAAGLLFAFAGSYYLLERPLPSHTLPQTKTGGCQPDRGDRAMLKRLTMLLLTFIAGVAGNLVAGYIQADVWQNFFTPDRLLVTAVSAGLILFILALLESERGLAWNWPWHRFWYLRGLAANPQIRQWEADFARLNLARGKRPITTTEVMATGRRQDMVTLLYDAFLQKDNDQRRVLVLGEPGAGKTTGLERLALEFARQDAWRLGIGRPLPILLRLGNYRDGDLITFVREEMGRAVGGQSGMVLSHGLETLLAKGRVVLLCDALDEALGEQRNLVLSELDRFLRSPRYDRVSVVITARTREDPGGRLPPLPVYTIQDLHDEAVRAFIAVYCQPDADKAAIYERLESAGLLEAGGMGRNPFWLRSVVESGVFQGQKGKILDEAVTTLLRREWDKPETERSGWQRVLLRDEQLLAGRQALAWLAYRMSAAGLVAADRKQGQQWVEAGLRGEDSPEQLRAAHVIGLGRDAQLLTYLSDKLRFCHRLLQEALTAWLLAENSDLRAEVVAQYDDDTDWWETLLMLGHLVAEPEALIADVLANGGSEQRLFLAVGLLQGIAQPDENLRQQVLATLRQSLEEGITDEHRMAIMALAQINRDDVIVFLRQLFSEAESSLQADVLDLLVTLGSDAVTEALFVEEVPLQDRIEFGRILAGLGDPRPGVSVDLMIGLPDILWGEEVPAGTYTVGGDKDAWGGSKKRQILIAQPYRLACYSVTNAQFQSFIDAPDRGKPDWWEGIPGDEKQFSQPRWSCANHPRETVSWYQALAFCRWLTAKLHKGLLQKLPIAPSELEKYVITLPHEYEWEVAARWPNEAVQERIYPWGPEFVAEKTNTNEGGIGQTTAVGIYPSGKNAALDLYDLSGNAWEWCRNQYDEPDGDQDPEKIDMGNDERVVRGGSWYVDQSDARAAVRGQFHPDVRNGNYSFRVVLVLRSPSHLNH